MPKPVRLNAGGFFVPNIAGRPMRNILHRISYRNFIFCNPDDSAHQSPGQLSPLEIQIMSDITDKLDAAVNAAIAKIQAAGDVTALNAQITQLTADKAALQADLDAANADAVKNTDALNAVTEPAPAA